jgi:hypothetical protein
MVWVRKGIVLLLSLVLLVSLVGDALAVSINLNLAHPQKLETWLSQSNFYGSLITNELHNARQSASNDQGAGRVSLDDQAVQQAVKSVFSAQLLRQYVNTFINSNYAWLEGKTATPSFTIDLTAAKQKLAKQIGQAVETRVAHLPACSSAQQAQLSATLNSDPLSIPCRPAGFNPQIAVAQVEAQISQSRDFLNNTVLTAKTLSPNGNNSGQPYYQKLSALPKLYRLNRQLPWIFGGFAVLSAVGIIFIAPRKRRGVRRIGWVLLVAGVLLIAVKLTADAAFNRLEKRFFSHSNLTLVQQSLTDFLHRLESQLMRVDLWFGVVFLALAALVLGVLWFTRERSGGGRAMPAGPAEPAQEQVTGERPPLPTLKQPPKPKRSRLIQ